MPGEIFSENKLRYIISAEISLESTCDFGLKHLGTNMQLLVWHAASERVCSDIQGVLSLVEVKWLAVGFCIVCCVSRAFCDI